jgi:hypothetical protein
MEKKKFSSLPTWGAIHALYLARPFGKRAAGGVTMNTLYQDGIAAKAVACIVPPIWRMKGVKRTSRPVIEAASMNATET